MKKFEAIASGLRLAACKSTSILVLTASLGAGFWLASSPLAHGKLITPAEMIQNQLPAQKTIASASADQLLQAVCKAVHQSPKDAALLVRTAAGGRKNLRSDILCTAVRCQREKHDLDCSWVVALWHEWTKDEPGEANQLSETVLHCAPDCTQAMEKRETNITTARQVREVKDAKEVVDAKDAKDIPAEPPGEAGFANPPNNVNPAPGTVGGGGASVKLCSVCHNGQVVQIACSSVDAHLKSHPGDTAGPCQATPDLNR